MGIECCIVLDSAITVEMKQASLFEKCVEVVRYISRFTQSAITSKGTDPGVAGGFRKGKREKHSPQFERSYRRFI